MKALLLLVTLSNQGYWYGGQIGRIEIDWAIDPRPVDAALVSWELKLGHIALASGELAIDSSAPRWLDLELPKLRAPTTFEWHYRVTRIGDDVELGRGDRSISAHPQRLLAAHGRRIMAAGNRLVVVDPSGTLARQLATDDVEHTRVDRVSAAANLRPDVLVVAAGALGHSWEEAALMRLVRSGTGVIMFEQSDRNRLLGLELRPVPVPTRLEVAAEHPLTQGLGEIGHALTRSWFGAETVWPLRLAKVADGKPLIHWPSQLGDEEDAPAVRYPVDALLVARTMGAGRVVVCQLPLGPWASDPRPSLLLGRALTTLSARSQTTVTRTTNPRDVDSKPHNSTEPPCDR